MLLRIAARSTQATLLCIAVHMQPTHTYLALDEQREVAHGYDAAEKLVIAPWVKDHVHALDPSPGTLVQKALHVSFLLLGAGKAHPRCKDEMLLIRREEWHEQCHPVAFEREVGCTQCRIDRCPCQPRGGSCRDDDDVERGVVDDEMARHVEKKWVR